LLLARRWLVLGLALNRWRLRRRHRWPLLHTGLLALREPVLLRHPHPGPWPSRRALGRQGTGCAWRPRLRELRLGLELSRLELLASACGRPSIRAHGHPHAVLMLLELTLSWREPRLARMACVGVLLRLGVGSAPQEPEDAPARLPVLGLVGRRSLLGWWHRWETVPRLSEASGR
jgi:hypothetical protein